MQGFSQCEYRTVEFLTFFRRIRDLLRHADASSTRDSRNPPSQVPSGLRFAPAPIKLRIMSSRNTPTGVLLVLASAVLFSTKSIFIKLGYREAVDPVILLTLRMVLALPFFLAMGLWARHRERGTPLTAKDWIALALLGIGGYYLAALLDFLGLQYISAGLERLTLFLYPTITVLITAFWLRRPVRGRTWMAIAVSYVGMALVVWPDLHSSSSRLGLGITLVFGSAVAYAIYLVGSGEMIQRIGANRFTSIALSIASLTCAIHFLIAHPVSALVVSPKVAMLGLTLAVACTVLPATLLTNGIRHIGATQAALIGAVGPVATLYLGYIVLGEKLDWAQAMGTALVLGGVLMVSLNR
ncbi:MAG: Integral rane protein [Moraxellaceae bacterium]|jgi:drug/metabolite transporter (DMT)-like permease|nr:Integral rane protein [Moraxellaceae bacterium]